MFRIAVTAYKKRGVRRKSQHKTQAQTLRGQSYQLVDKHSVLNHTLVGFLVHVAGEGNGILFSTSHHRYLEEIGVEFAHMYGRRVPFVKQFQRSIIDKASSRPGASGSIEGRLHSISLTYKPSISLSGSLALGRLVCSGGPIVVSTAGASLIA